jgi:hypothetical protein
LSQRGSQRQCPGFRDFAGKLRLTQVKHSENACCMLVIIDVLKLQRQEKATSAGISRKDHF